MRDHPFFKGVELKEFDMEGIKIQMPILYYDVFSFTGIFSARTSALKRLLPDPNFKILELYPGRGLVSITAFEYFDTSIGPYNEIAICIPIVYPPRFTVPGLTVLGMNFKRLFTVYIHRLPVTTEIALKGGIYFWNYPKFLAKIEFEKEKDFASVNLEYEGKKILRMKGKRRGRAKEARLEFHTFSTREDIVMRGRVIGLAGKASQSFMPGTVELELGDHPFALELKETAMSTGSLFSFFLEELKTQLYAPDICWDRKTLAQVPVKAG